MLEPTQVVLAAMNLAALVIGLIVIVVRDGKRTGRGIMVMADGARYEGD